MAKTKEQTFGLSSIAMILGFANSYDPKLLKAIIQLAHYTLPDNDNIQLVKMTMHQIMKLENDIKNTAVKRKGR